VCDQVFGGQVNHTLARANEIVRGLAHLPRPSMLLQPNHHAEDMGARLGDPSGLNVLMSATGVPK